VRNLEPNQRLTVDHKQKRKKSIPRNVTVISYFGKQNSQLSGGQILTFQLVPCAVTVITRSSFTLESPYLPMHARTQRPRILATIRLLFVAVVASSATLHAAAPVQRPAQVLVLRSPAGLTEVGLLDGAAYRIDVPTHWNHSLVVFYHGYALRPASFHIAERLTGQQAPFFERRYAVIQSAYSRTGWALQQAYPETESLRRYFIRKYGQPRETYVAGGSMGGQLVAITLELNPTPYLGGLDLCGSVGPTYESFGHRFAMRAAFDVYFPAVMPPLVPVPTNYEDTTIDRDKVLAALRSDPAAATLLRNLTGLHSDLDLAHDIAYWTFVVEDMQNRGGGNPFDNRNYVYSGTGSTSGDLELNEKVKRYAALPQANAYLTHHYSPNGHLGRPMLALHTIYDPIVQISQLALYGREIQAAGAEDNFVQQIVDREGHCNFTQIEIGDAFDEMVRWAHGGTRPAPGVLNR
jgi:pimeloyl-ACP methyl ester carboxylesterase